MSIGYFQWTKIGCFRWTRSGSFRRTLTMTSIFYFPFYQLLLCLILEFCESYVMSNSRKHECVNYSCLFLRGKLY